MIDQTLSTRMALLAVRSEKHAYLFALNAIDRLPIKDARALIQETLDGCEDLEISYERKLETVVPIKHSCI